MQTACIRRQANHLSRMYVYLSRFIPKGEQRHLGYFSETPTFYQNDLALKNTVDISGKPMDI
jgi:hypothetical protein